MAPITHSVFFRLKDSADEQAFLDSCRGMLAPIPGVREFRVLRETSPKNDFAYGLTMNFADRKAYDDYSEHPDHVHFVQNIWIPNVAEFQEIDYVEVREV